MRQSACVKYEDLPPISRADFDAACRTGTSEQQAGAIIRLALHDGDPGFVEQECNRLLDEDDIAVRRAALIAVGHVARVHRQVSAETKARIRSLESDPDVAGNAADALDDIATFVHS